MGINLNSNVNKKQLDELSNKLASKQNSIPGKSLSTNDYDNAAKQQVALITNKVDKGSATTPLIWRAPVATIADLKTIYPSALKDWAAIVKESGFIYAYDGTNWNNTGLKSFPEEVALTLTEMLLNERYAIQSATFNSDEIMSSANVIWEDGTVGTLTFSHYNEECFAYDSYLITYDTKRIIQPKVTRNDNGVIVNQPNKIIQ